MASKTVIRPIQSTTLNLEKKVQSHLNLRKYFWKKKNTFCKEMRTAVTAAKTSLCKNRQIQTSMFSAV